MLGKHNKTQMTGRVVTTYHHCCHVQVQIRTEEELDKIVIDTQNVVLDAVQNSVTKLVFRKRRERNQGFVRIKKEEHIAKKKRSRSNESCTAWKQYVR